MPTRTGQRRGAGGAAASAVGGKAEHGRADGEGGAGEERELEAEDALEQRVGQRRAVAIFEAADRLCGDALAEAREQRRQEEQHVEVADLAEAEAGGGEGARELPSRVAPSVV